MAERIGNDKVYENLKNNGGVVVIEGQVTFASLREKKESNSKFRKGEKTYQISVVDPKVVKGADTELGKRIATDDGQYSNSFYKSKSGKHAGDVMFSYESSPNAKFPVNLVDLKTKQEGPINEMTEHEFGEGQTVQLAIQLFKMKSGSFAGSVGLGLNGVAVTDLANAKFYEGGASDAGSLFGVDSTKSITKATDEKPEDDNPFNSESDDSNETSTDDLFS